MTPLRMQMTEDMRVAGLAAGTQRIYLDGVRRLAEHYGVVQIRVTPKTRNPFTIRALSISGVTWKRHFLNHAGLTDTGAAGDDQHLRVQR